jgi:hypothetical protein
MAFKGICPLEAMQAMAEAGSGYRRSLLLHNLGCQAKSQKIFRTPKKSSRIVLLIRAILLPQLALPANG